MKKINKILCFILALIMAISTCSMMVSAETGEDEQYIKNLLLNCSRDGTVRMHPTPAPGNVFAYITTTGAFSETLIADNHNVPVGTYTVDLHDFTLLDTNIKVNIQGKPHVQVIEISETEWNAKGNATILGYGHDIVEIAKPYIKLNTTFTFDSYIPSSAIGDNDIGLYSYDTARADFLNWYTDKEATSVAQTDVGSYAVFDLYSAGGFATEINPADMVLRTKTDTYTGGHIISRSTNKMRVSFLISSITPEPPMYPTMTAKSPVEGVKVLCAPAGSYNWAESATAKRSPIDNSLMPITVCFQTEPGYEITKVIVNGEPRDDIRPYGKNVYYPLSTTEPDEKTVNVTIEVDSVVTCEVRKTDKITIVYDEKCEARCPTTYYAPEGYGAQLCRRSDIYDVNTRRYLYALNTKPDGTGYNVPRMDEVFVWGADAPGHNNLQYDEITLYAMVYCSGHYELNGSVAGTFTEFAAKEATCTTTGNIRYRTCSECGAYEYYNEGAQKWLICTYQDTIVPVKEHDCHFSAYDDNTHTKACRNCSFETIEDHNFVNGKCICGAIDSAAYIVGDINSDGEVTDADATYLLYYTIFPDDYPISQPADYDKDGTISDADANYLLYYTIFPDDYPLN
jgi:hypothetical protein